MPVPGTLKVYFTNCTIKSTRMISLDDPLSRSLMKDTVGIQEDITDILPKIYNSQTSLDSLKCESCSWGHICYVSQPQLL